METSFIYVYLRFLQNIKAWTDAGDVIGAKGTVKRTDKGELSVYVSSWAMLTKSLLPLPDKFHGLRDTEKRYRQVGSFVQYVSAAQYAQHACSQGVMKSSLRREPGDFSAGMSDGRQVHHGGSLRPPELRVLRAVQWAVRPQLVPFVHAGRWAECCSSGTLRTTRDSLLLGRWDLKRQTPLRP